MTARPAYAAPPPAPVYTWTGMYLGANIGYSWGQSKNDRTLPGFGVTINETQNIDGVIGGGQTGYNYQFGAWVWGFESDLQASRQKGSAVIPVIPGATLSTEIISSSGSEPRVRAWATWRLPTSCCTGRVAWPMARPPQLSVFPRPLPWQV
jgi:outer membrane immunogenic protein